MGRGDSYWRDFQRRLSCTWTGYLDQGAPKGWGPGRCPVTKVASQIVASQRRLATAPSRVGNKDLGDISRIGTVPYPRPLKPRLSATTPKIRSYCRSWPRPARPDAYS